MKNKKEKLDQKKKNATTSEREGLIEGEGEGKYRGDWTIDNYNWTSYNLQSTIIYGVLLNTGKTMIILAVCKIYPTD